MIKNNWNLKDLFENEELLQSSADTALQRASVFVNIYQNNLKMIKPLEFLEAIKEYESIQEQIAKVITYAFLKFSVDSTLGAFFAKYEEIYANVCEKLLFFELEFNRLNKQLQNSFILTCKEYEYYLKSLQKAKSHQLSQKEERILLKKSITSSSAFSRLFDEIFSKLSFSYENKKISEEEVLSLLYSPDRQVRKNAALSLSKGLKPNQHVLGYIFNMIKKDLKIDCDIRGYKLPESSRHQDNKISQKSVNTLVKTTKENFHIVHQYYEIKRKLLGYEKLYDYDRYAPLKSSESKYEFEDAKNIVLKAFEDFSPKFYKVAKMAFDDQWIDIYPQKNKRSGAFSHPAVPSSHPYVLLNFTNQRRDVFTLAHELGHAIHQYFAKDVGFLGSDTPLTTAETASVFAEMLVYESIKETLSKEDKIALIAGKLEDIFATLFRQINFTTFERRVHEFDGEISLDRLNEFWMDENKQMFGKSVTLSSNYETWWSYIPHFIHSPFYCYAYSYGQLLVLALFGLFKSKKINNFEELYVSFLSHGGSKSPKELVGMFGFDIEDDKFWKIGLLEIEKILNEFKGLVDVG